jgi:hypothetical protein
MRKGTTFIVTLFMMLLLSLILGAVLAGQGRPSPEHQAHMEALQLETSAKMRAIKVGFWGGLTVVVLLCLAGVSVGLVRAVWLRSRLIHPQANGLFPVVQGRTGGRILRPGSRYTYYHDPNRQVAGSVAYGTDSEGASARPILPTYDQGEQLQVTTQAQAAQLVAAAGQGRGLTAQSRRLVERVALVPAARAVPRLPDVVIPDEAIPEERHLLTALRADWERERWTTEDET